MKTVNGVHVAYGGSSRERYVEIYFGEDIQKLAGLKKGQRYTATFSENSARLIQRRNDSKSRGVVLSKNVGSNKLYVRVRKAALPFNFGPAEERHGRTQVKWEYDGKDIIFDLPEWFYANKIPTSHSTTA